MEGHFVRYLYPFFDNGIAILGCAEKIPEESTEEIFVLKLPDRVDIEYLKGCIEDDEYVNAFFKDDKIKIPSKYVRPTPALFRCRTEVVFVTTVFKPNDIVFDRGDQRQFLVLDVAGVSPKYLSGILYNVLPLTEWWHTKGDEQRSFFKPQWKPGSAKPVLNAQPTLLSDSNNISLCCVNFTPLQFLEKLRSVIQHWRFGQIGSICADTVGDYQLKLFGKKVTLTTLWFCTLSLSSLTLVDDAYKKRPFNHKVVEHVVIVTDKLGTTCFQEGDWVCYDTSKKKNWEFIKSSKELLRFVKWIRDPPKQFPKKIYFGPFYPFVLAYYEKPYTSRDVDCFIRDLYKND